MAVGFLEGKDGASKTWTLSNAFDLYERKLYPELHLILSFGEPGDSDYRSLLEKYFRLGPNGLRPFIDCLVLLHNKIVASKPHLSNSDLARFIEGLNRIAQPMLQHLLSFRSFHLRAEFDPPGYADIQATLLEPDIRKKFPVRSFINVFIFLAHLICRMRTPRMRPPVCV